MFLLLVASMVSRMVEGVECACFMEYGVCRSVKLSSPGDRPFGFPYGPSSD